jgi:hypothetical protein
LALALALTLAAAPGLTRLRIRTDGHALVPTHDERIDTDRAIRIEFGVEDPVVVMVRPGANARPRANAHERANARAEDSFGIYNLDTLALIQTLTNELATLPGVNPAMISSLATDRGHRVYPGTLTPRPFLDPPPRSDADLARISDDVRAIRLFTGVLVSDDERAGAIFVGMPHGVDRLDFLRRLGDLVARHRDATDRIDVIGAPVAESLLGTHILEDLGAGEWMLGHGSAVFVEDAPDARSGPSAVLRGAIGRYVGLVPVAMLVMMLVFMVCFRSAIAAALPMIEVGACLVFVFGLMGLFDVPIYLTIAVMPVILTAVGVADEVHVFHRYFKEIRTDPTRSHVEALRETMREMWVPVVKTSVTTAIGFCSFALSPIAAVRAFGVFTAVGVVFCMMWTLAVIPALLAMIPPAWVRSKRTVRPHPEPPAFARAVVSRPSRWIALLLAAAVLGLAPLGVRRLVVQDSWIDGFSPDSAFRTATEYFNEHFLGAHILAVCVDAGDFELAGRIASSAVGHHEIRIRPEPDVDPSALSGSVLELSLAAFSQDRDSSNNGTWTCWIDKVTVDDGEWVVTFLRPGGSPVWALETQDAAEVYFRVSPRPLARPEVLERVAAFERFLGKQKAHAVGGVHGPATYLATTHFISGALNEARRRIPERIPKVRDEWANHRRVRGEGWHRRTVNDHFSRGLINVYMKDANFIETGRLIEKIREYERETLSPHGMHVTLAGDVAVSQTLISGIVTTQVRSVLGSLAGILVVSALLGGSIRWGVYCVLPVTAAVLVNFAAMGWLGVPLGVATSMFSGMTLGIGVDYAIHVMERYRLAQRRGADNRDAVVDAVQASGQANVIDGLGVALGFGVVTLSQVPANARLGGLIVLSIATCLLLTLVLLPALLSIWPINPRSAPRDRVA